MSSRFPFPEGQWVHPLLMDAVLVSIWELHTDFGLLLYQSLKTIGAMSRDFKEF